MFTGSGVSTFVTDRSATANSELCLRFVSADETKSKAIVKSRKVMDRFFFM